MRPAVEAPTTTIRFSLLRGADVLTSLTQTAARRVRSSAMVVLLPWPV
jgi:hypothetical protein